MPLCPSMERLFDKSWERIKHKWRIETLYNREFINNETRKKLLSLIWSEFDKEIEKLWLRDTIEVLRADEGIEKEWDDYKKIRKIIYRRKFCYISILRINSRKIIQWEDLLDKTTWILTEFMKIMPKSLSAIVTIFANTTENKIRTEEISNNYWNSLSEEEINNSLALLEKSWIIEKIQEWWNDFFTLRSELFYICLKFRYLSPRKRKIISKDFQEIELKDFIKWNRFSDSRLI